MKNFRKVLALILVVATLFSFVAMVGAREVGDYTDYDKVNYQEAVDVLTAVGVLDGYTDGSFQPTSTITRAEMAKMIAVLSNAGTDVKDLYAGSCKFADSKNNWAASYIAYCANTGIVAGRNSTTFDPSGKVTGVETAKMLLCVLGFDASYQKYVGTNWMTYVMADAKNYGLLAGFAADYDITKAITREEAAQMMLNALKANMVVGTLSDSIIKLSNSLYVDLYLDEEFGIDIGFTLDDAQKYGWIVLDGNVVISPVPLYKIYDGLECEDGYDCYNNPSIVWTYTNSKGTESTIGTYVLGADYSFSTEVDFEDVLNEEIEGKKTYYVEVYVDGARQTDVGGYKADEVNWSDVQKLTGKGVETHIYVDDRIAVEGIKNPIVDSGVVVGRIVVTIKNTFIGRIEETYNASATFKLEDATYRQRTYSNKYGFEKGDVILYWLCENEEETAYNLHDAEVVTPVTTDVTRAEYEYNSKNATATGDGKTYEYAYNVFNNIDMDNNDDLFGRDFINHATGSTYGGHKYSTYDLYLDKYGYIMAWEETPSSTTYEVAYLVPGTLKGAFVERVDDTDYFNYTATVVDFDGEKKTVTFTDRTGTGDVATLYDELLDERDPYGVLITYKYSGEKIVLADMPDVYSSYAGSTDNYLADGTLNKTYLSSDGHLVRKDGSGIYMSRATDTKYLVKVGDTYTACTYKDLKDYVTADDYDTYDQTYSIQYFYQKSGNGNLLAYVFIDVEYTLANVRAFVAGYNSTVTDREFADALGTGYFNYRGYNAIIDGKEAILAVTKAQENELNLAARFQLVNAALQYEGVVDTAGGNLPLYTLVSFVDAQMEYADTLSVDVDSKQVVLTTEEAVVDSNLDVTYDVADDAILVVTTAPYDTETHKWVTKDADAAVVTLEGLANVADDFGKTGAPHYELKEAWYVIENGKVVELYVNCYWTGSTQGWFVGD